MGNGLVGMRVRSRLHEADWIAEQLGGITHLFFLRQLAAEIDRDWDGVAKKLEAIRQTVVNRGGLVANVTTESAEWQKFAPQLEAFLDGLPSRDNASRRGRSATWRRPKG